MRRVPALSSHAKGFRCYCKVDDVKLGNNESSLPGELSNGWDDKRATLRSPRSLSSHCVRRSLRVWREWLFKIHSGTSRNRCLPQYLRFGVGRFGSDE